jgi:glucose/arabinose dehydrogenase
VAGVPAVRALGQGGLQEVAVHPNFAQNHFIYLSYAKPRGENGAEGTTALARAKFENDKLVDVKEIFEAKAWNNAPGHFGARIAFDKQNHLFMSVGDRMAGLFPRRPDGAMDPDLAGHPAQNLGSHQGKILRLNDDGTVPQDNPFVGRAGALPEIWSYGHRNPQGLAVDPVTGDLWETEHAPQGGDELNWIQKGRNYGWPVIGYGIDYSGASLHASTHKEGMEQPIYYWRPSIAPSGMAFYTGDLFPSWRGHLLVGALAGRSLHRLVLDGEGIAGEEVMLRDLSERIRDVRMAPDGAVLLLTDSAEGRVLRLTPRR